VQWALFKPEGVNSTIFWNTDFNFGVGLLPTLVVTGGLLGALAWVVFLALFLYQGIKYILFRKSDKTRHLFALTSFLSAAYLWIIAIVYVPGIVTFALAFIFTGASIAALRELGVVKEARWNFLGEPRVVMVAVLFFIGLVIASIFYGYVIFQKFVASTFFEQGINAANKSGGFASASTDIKRAVALDEQDTYYRGLSEVTILQLNQIIASGNLKDSLTQSDAQTLLISAIESARHAIDLDSSDYLNWLTLARVYESVVPLKVAGSYEQASVAYNRALALNPQSPLVYLNIARLEAAAGDTKKARDYANQSLGRKNDFVDAVFFLAQLELNAGNSDGAVKYLEQAASALPNNADVLFNLGLLKYQNKDWKDAVSVLGRAVALNPSFANARYFLGLSLYEVGRTADAISQFETIATTNPDNVSLKDILKNLRAGRTPLSK
jgi:tetratricopeptide (TPR) repeat protein